MKERTESDRRKEQRYKDSHYDRIAIMIPKGERDKWKQWAEERGFSLKAFIVSAIEEYVTIHPIRRKNP